MDLVQQNRHAVPFQQRAVNAGRKAVADGAHQPVADENVQMARRRRIVPQAVHVVRPYQIGGIDVDDACLFVQGVFIRTRDHNKKFPVIVIVQQRIVPVYVMESQVVLVLRRIFKKRIHAVSPATSIPAKRENCKPFTGMEKIAQIQPPPPF